MPARVLQGGRLPVLAAKQDQTAAPDSSRQELVLELNVVRGRKPAAARPVGELEGVGRSPDVGGPAVGAQTAISARHVLSLSDQISLTHNVPLRRANIRRSTKRHVAKRAARS